MRGFHDLKLIADQIIKAFFGDDWFVACFGQQNNRRCRSHVIMQGHGIIVGSSSTYSDHIPSLRGGWQEYIRLYDIS